jgi:hypothetical protein
MLRQNRIAINFMKKIISIFSILITCTTALQAQSHDEYAIYDTIVKMYKRRMPVPFHSTDTRTLKEFNFKDQTDFLNNYRDTLNSEWRVFFNHIDVSDIKSGELDKSFLMKYPQLSPSARGITFSPIVISTDGSKAICGAHLDNGGKVMYLFEKKNGKWVFRKLYIISRE